MTRRRHRPPVVSVRETWRLQLDDGRVLHEGYSCRPLRSPEDVRGDFDRSLGGTPVLLTRSTTEVFE